MRSASLRGRYLIRPRPTAASSFEFSPLSRSCDELPRERTDLLPPGIEATRLQAREYSYLAPGLAKPVRVTTSAAYYEQNPDSAELWSAGNPLFPTLEAALLPVSAKDALAVVKTRI